MSGTEITERSSSPGEPPPSSGRWSRGRAPRPPLRGDRSQQLWEWSLWSVEDTGQWSCSCPSTSWWWPAWWWWWRCWVSWRSCQSAGRSPHWHCVAPSRSRTSPEEPEHWTDCLPPSSPGGQNLPPRPGQHRHYQPASGHPLHHSPLYWWRSEMWYSSAELLRQSSTPRRGTGK